MKKYFVIFVAILALVVSGAIFLHAVTPVSTDKSTVNIDIPSGASTGYIASILKEKNLINSSTAFKLVSKFKNYDGKYKAGVYAVSPSMSMEKMMKIISEGKSDTLRLTIPEGFTLSQIAEKFESLGISTQDEFWYEIENGKFNYKFVNNLPEGKTRLEGFLYPETYFIYKNTTAHECIDRMLSQFNSLFTNEYYEKAASMNLSVREVVTIASLIERETNADNEGGKVASVIYNRLKAGRLLQIDASVQYALPNHKTRLTYDDLQVDSPYNTYKYKGLPIGPICSPGISAINAALNPENTDYFYYVLSPKNDGTHNFSHSYDEFLVNKQKYKESLK